MNDAEKIQVAADMIREMMHRQGSVISEADALRAARKLHDIWFDRAHIADAAPGTIAQRFRERYEGDVQDGPA